MYDLLIRMIDGKCAIQIDSLMVGHIYVQKLDERYGVLYGADVNDSYLIDCFETEEAAKRALDNICKGIANDWSYIKLNSDGSCNLG